MKQYIERSLTYTEYLSLIDDLLEQGKITGPNQSSAMFEYGRINRQRMKRLDKTLEVLPKVAAAAGEMRSPMLWLIITEGWCGDAAQNVPVIESVAAASPLLETRYILRDENLELMDRFLTRGARSIPKLIALDPETLEVKGTWGPRPAPAQALYDDLKANDIPKPEIMEKLQRWYNEDRGRSAQLELIEVMTAASGRSASTAG
jgi:hypothetical protein